MLLSFEFKVYSLCLLEVYMLYLLYLLDSRCCLLHIVINIKYNMSIVYAISSKPFCITYRRINLRYRRIYLLHTLACFLTYRRVTDVFCHIFASSMGEIGAFTDQFEKLEGI